MASVVSIRKNTASENQTGGAYRLLELPTDLCKLIETDPSNIQLSIKGKDTDDAILCTGAQTYALRAVNVSNSFVIATGSLTDGQEEVFIQDEIHEIMEIIPTVPRLERIRAVLRGCEYGRDITSSNSMETDNPPEMQRKYTRAELADIIQASDLEFAKALDDYHILLLEDYLHPLPLEQLAEILVFIFTSLISYGLPRKKTPASKLVDILHSDHEVPPDVSKQVLKWFGELNEDLWTMDEMKAIRQTGLGILKQKSSALPKEPDILRLWKEAVGDAFAHHVDLKLLRGEYLLQPSESMMDPQPTVTYFSRSSLPTDPLSRFNELFLTRNKWKEQDIVAFLEDIAVDKKDVDRLLIKFARRSADRDGTVYFTARTGYI